MLLSLQQVWGEKEARFGYRVLLNFRIEALIFANIFVPENLDIFVMSSKIII